MSASFYFALLIPALAQIGLGRFFVRDGDIFSALLAGLLVSAGLISPLAYWRVDFVLPMLWALLVVGLVLWVGQCRGGWRTFSLKPRREWLWLLLLGGLLLWLLRSLHYANYVFESHDVLYFGPLNEMLRGDVAGPLRVGVAWPARMASNHLLPAAIVAVLSPLQTVATLVTAIEVRYLLVVGAVSSFCWQGYRQGRGWLAASLLLLLALFRQDLAMELRLSSFVYVLVLLEILKRVFSPRVNARELIFFAAMLVIAKATILQVALVLLAWYWWRFAEERWTWRTFLMAGLIAWNALGWKLAPPPYGQDHFWSLAHPLKWRAVLSFQDIPAWVAPEAVATWLGSIFSGPWLITPMVLYVLAKYYLTYFGMIQQAARPWLAGGGQRAWDKFRGLDLYVLASLASWVLLRNGPWEIGHQVHAYLLLAVVSATVLAYGLTTLSRSWQLGIGALLLLALLLAPDRDDWLAGGAPNPEHSDSILRYRDVAAGGQVVDGFYLPLADEPVALAQVRAAMQGVRLRASDLGNGANHGAIKHWILQ